MEKRGDITEATPLSIHDSGPGVKSASDADKFDQDTASRAKNAAANRFVKDKSTKKD